MITLYRWLLKRIGYHVCEEWTQWMTLDTTYNRLPNASEIANYSRASKRIPDVLTFTVRYQERQCTICGKVEQRELKYQ